MSSLTQSGVTGKRLEQSIRVALSITTLSSYIGILTSGGNKERNLKKSHNMTTVKQE